MAPGEILNLSNTNCVSSPDDTHIPGYSSGASTPADDRSLGSLDGSTHRRGFVTKSTSKSLLHTSSILGLDKMIEDRKGEGDLKSNVVHIEVPFGKPIEEVYDGVHDGVVLGSGISGLVRLVSHKATGVKYAVKCLDLGLVETEEGLQQLREEIYIMCQLDHPNIVRLEEVYESHNEIYLVQELCVGGELFDRLDEQPDYHYTEAQCARLVKQMLCSVRYIHSKGIIHRDLKLENFLFSSNSPDSELKMIDFGLSKHFKFGEVQHEAVGTPYTVAPEVIKGSYDERCDVWAIGVITFLLLSGDPPFGGCGGPEPLMQVRENILRGKFEFEPEDVWLNVSATAKEFIRAHLVTDPNRRPTAREAQKAQWLREWAHRDGKKDRDNVLSPNVVKALVNFKEYSDMRKLLCEVLSFTLLPDQIEDLRHEFAILDTDGSGEISLAALKQVLVSNAGAGSLGGLKEDEVEDIFNAMRVRKTETRIHWHEFIAAGLSQCKVDDRNLKLAFDRLDSDHKGYITFENVMDLLGNDASESEDAMRSMWGDSMKACNSISAQITYEDFLLLMKGQTKQDKPDVFTLGSSTLGPGSIGMGLDVVHEHVTSDQVQLQPSGSQPNEDNVLVLPSGDVVAKVEGAITMKLAPPNQLIPSPSRLPPPLSAPSTPIGLYGKTGEEDEISDGPLMLDDDDDMDNKILEAADNVVMVGLQIVASDGCFYANESRDRNLTPPQSPKRGAGDYITPISHRKKLSPSSLGDAPMLSGLPSPLASSVRLRSRSVDAQDTHTGEHAAIEVDDSEQSPVFMPDIRRAMLLPEHNHNLSDIEEVIKDETKTPLVVNRKLYRAHRQLRLAVLDASKRFEEQQVSLTKKMINEQKKNDGQLYGAGLTMRHGLAKEMSSDDIRQLLKKQHRKQQNMVDKANKRGGRGRRTRKKTISDMTGMMSSPPPGEMLMDPTGSSESLNVGAENKKGVLEVLNEKERIQSDSAAHEPLRRPTTPGVFHNTVDPFNIMAGLQHMLGKQSKFPPIFSSLANESTTNKKVLKKIDPLFDASTHSMRSVASDSDIKVSAQAPSPLSLDESNPSPQVSATKNIDASSSWPPPPPF